MMIEIYFDGGCEPNPGRKYGSYEVLFDGVQAAKWSRFDLGKGTNNEAEFESLEAALLEVGARLAESRVDKSTCVLKISTDSVIVRNRLVFKNAVHKRAKYREPSERMFKLADRCLRLMRDYRSFSVEWEKRDANVARFGH